MTTTTPTTAAALVADPFPVAVWQRRGLVAGGVLFAIGNALHPLEHTDAAYRGATWEAAHLVILASLPLLILGLPGLHRVLGEGRTGRLAAISIGATIVGLIGLAPGMIVEAFVAPSIGHEAMQDLEAGGMGAVSGLFGSAYLGGSVALGWAGWRAGLRPRWAPLALLVATIVLVLSMGLTGPFAGVVIITGTVVVGLALALMGRAVR